MRYSIETHLTVVFAAMAVTGLSTKLVGASRNLCAPPAAPARCRSQSLTAADPLPDDRAEALAKINSHNVHQFGPTEEEIAHSAIVRGVRPFRNCRD